MKKNKITKIIAFIALFWIIIWIVWTWALIIFWNNKSEKITQSQLQDLIKSQSWIVTNYNSWTNTINTSNELNNFITTSTWFINNSWSINSSTWWIN